MGNLLNEVEVALFVSTVIEPGYPPGIARNRRLELIRFRFNRQVGVSHEFLFIALRADSVRGHGA